MSNQPREAFYRVIQFWPLVLALGFGQALVTSGVWKEFATPVVIAPIVILTVAISILVYGRILGTFLPGKSIDSITILKENWLNYLVAMLVIGAPEFVFRVFGMRMNTTVGQYFTISILINAIVALLTAYAIPLVFLKRTNLSAVLGGLIYLAQNARSSVWVVGIVGVALALHAGGIVVLRLWPNLLSTVAVVCVGLIVAFLYLMSFSAATQVLLGSSRELPKSNA